MKRVLVLSGGGSKGAYQSGILSYLLGDLGVHYDGVVGVSVGAINGAEVAANKKGEEGYTAERLIKNWETVSTDQIYKRWYPFGKVHAGWFFKKFMRQWRKPSLFNSAPLRTYLESRLNIEGMRTSGKEFRCGAVNINLRQYETFDQNYHDLLGAILASSSFPAAFCPIMLGDYLYTDGGIKEVTPLKTAIGLGATDIDVIICNAAERNPTIVDPLPTMIELGPEYLDIMSSEIERTDLDRCLEINEMIKNGCKIDGKKYININVMRPEKDLPYDSLNFEQDQVQPMFSQGLKDAKAQYKI